MLKNIDYEYIILANCSWKHKYSFSSIFSMFAIFCFFSSFEFFDKEATKSNKKTFKLCCIGLVVSLVLCVIVPSKSELYAICGIGSILDYAKDSKEVQKLPDNAVKALNIYLENIQKENSKYSE